VLYSTYLGGNDYTVVSGIGLSAWGDVYVVG
jgi:hypothetical protein